MELYRDRAPIIETEFKGWRGGDRRSVEYTESFQVERIMKLSCEFSIA